MNDTITSRADVTPHWVTRIHFLGAGFSGSPEAGMSFLPGAKSGYIWLVDPARHRDCKGQWQTDAAGSTWTMLCQDGLTAEGEMTDPSTGLGSGLGRDAKGQPVEFIFSPDAVR